LLQHGDTAPWLQVEAFLAALHGDTASWLKFKNAR
jgi:hypothetical protein